MKNAFKNNALLILFFISVFTLIFLILYTRNLTNKTIDMLLHSTEQHLISLSNSAANIATAEELEQIKTEADTDKPVYKEIKQRLADFSKKWQVKFTYYLRLTPDSRLQYIVDNVTDPEQADEMDGPESFIIPEDPLYAAPRKAIARGTVTTSGIYVPDIDGLMAAYTPVYDKNGKLYCVVGVDIQDEEFIKLKRKMPFINTLQMLAMIICMMSGFFGVILFRHKARLSMRASRAKSVFLANMSHEIRTPINAIIGMTNIAKSSADAKKKDYCLGQIEEASTHLLGVINDILDMSKIEAERFSLSVTEFDFEKVIQKSINIIKFRVNEKQQNLAVTIDKEIPKRVEGDEQRLKQVIANLLSNAVKFTPERGSIHISAHFVKEEKGVCTIQIGITDTGIGINDEQKPKLFDSFQQGDDSTSRKFGGTGLGLTISKRIVEMMGGKIWVTSKPEKGSTFSFTIKVKRPDKEHAVSLRPDINRKNVRILAVDDMPDTRKYFDFITKQLGGRCDTAENGEQALDLIKKNGPYDIYFIDLKMNGMDGMELSKRIKELSGKCITVIISSAETDSIEKDSRKTGVDKFLTKPLFQSDIAEIINESIKPEDDGGAKIKKEEPADTEYSFKGRRLLIADDVDINREIVMAILKPTQIEIDSARNGAEALKMFAENPEKYDIIFMDIQMPEMDGYTATRKIRELGSEKAKNVPIVAMTANVYKEDMDKAAQSGMNSHLSKPIDVKAVMEVLKKFLSKE